MSASSRLRWRVAREMAKVWLRPSVGPQHGVPLNGGFWGDQAGGLTPLGHAVMAHAESIADARGIVARRALLADAIPVLIAAMRLAESGAQPPPRKPIAIPADFRIRMREARSW